MLRRLSLALALAGLVTACDSNPPATVDAGSDAGRVELDGGPVDDDGGLGDAGPGDGGEPDGGPIDGGGPAPIPSDPIVLATSEAGHDRFYGVGFDPAGNIFAVGQTASTTEASADYSIVVAKFGPDGVLDTTFGDAGIATHNVTVGGRAREIARAVVVQSTGRIIVAGSAEHDPSNADMLLATDTDVVLVGFEPDGDLDTTFGEGGVARLDLGTGVITVHPTSGDNVLSANDDQWGLALASGDAIVVHARARGAGFLADGTTVRTDTDFALLRLTSDGELDTTFSDDGTLTLDIAYANASVRGVSVLADGSIIASGYTTSNALFPTMPTMTSQQPVIYKVTPSGAFDTTFATADATTLPGVWHDFAVMPPLRAEAYGAALQGDHLVTVGYGPTNVAGATSSDVISLRFTGAGAIDRTYGGGTHGAVTDPAGTTYVDVGGFTDNGHGVVVLPDQRVLGIGTGRPTSATESDGLVVVLTEDGAPDATFAAGGFRTYDMGLNDQLWAVALSPDGSRVAVVGLAGAETAADDDDAALLILAAD